MKVSIELALRTREVYQLFERRISKDRLFIETILHKFNVIMSSCRQQDQLALTNHTRMKRNIIGLTQQFTDEIAQFETLLTKKKDFTNKKVNYIVKFRPKIILTNPLSMQLIEFIEIYDKLIALLKLLLLAGCFDSDEVYFGNIKRYQKIVNKMLSTIVLTSLR